MLRIIAGRYGGRRIAAPRGSRTRPTLERVREAWFSALGDRIPGARVADLFAGSGALGIEALSRGARSVRFVESDRRTAALLRRNLRELGITTEAEVEPRDVADFLEELPEATGETAPLDLVLADPPYGSDWPERLAGRLRTRPFARLLCVEHAPGALPASGGELRWRREYGDTVVSFLSPVTDGGAPGGRGRR